MSTRKLIIAALICGMAILIAFTIQLTQAVHDRPGAPAPSSTAP